MIAKDGTLMRKVIDLECDLPPDEKRQSRRLKPPRTRRLRRSGTPEPLPGHGFSNYERIFTARRGRSVTRAHESAACRWPISSR
jgi:hypothetical protein